MHRARLDIPSLVSVAKRKIALGIAGLQGYSFAHFCCTYVCDMTHIMHERSTIRIIVRCCWLAAERGSGALACAPWLPELSPQPLCARELSGLYVG